MAVRRRVAVLGSFVALLSCTRAPSTPAPGPTPAPSAQPGVSEPPTAIVRRVPPSRDSLAKLRANYVAQVMHKIAGRENEPAEQVFENVQVLKGITAAELVRKMDKDYGEALSWNCTNCHRFAPQGNFASDTSNDKRRARFMQQMQNDINLVTLPKLYPKDTPKITCATCHRGYNEPPEGQYLLPERGKPGGLPPLRPRGAPPPAKPPAE
ncbi:MAG TPA: photosynthetic reaction center cytochrome c subunit family protein [Acidimicrobiia bacterium]|nr:photosynthetic reaction center cytochrome c subunit family protein [Acidimicrobiia bacterium]